MSVTAFDAVATYGLKLPPANLIRYCCGYDDSDAYARSSRETATMFTLAAHRHGAAPEFQNAVLDFGCGTGRVLGAMNFGTAAVSACDPGGPIAAFSKEAYPDVRVVHSDLMPPLPFKDEEFGLIYSYSVFSHLPEAVERTWLEELHRVGKPGCLYLITVHGEWMIEATLHGTEQADIRRTGFGFKKVHGRQNGILDFPDYYESSYHTKSYVYEHWSEWFEIIDMIKGDEPQNYLYDGLAFESRGGFVPDFRPMGQDLVVARKR